MFSIIKKLTDMFAVEFDNFYNLYIDAYPEMNKHLDIFDKINLKINKIKNAINWDSELQEDYIVFIRELCDAVFDEDFCLYSFLWTLKYTFIDYFSWIDLQDCFLWMTQIYISKDEMIKLLLGVNDKD